MERKMSTKYLKVKIKSLAEESKIIRKEERKLRRPRLVIESPTSMINADHQLYIYTDKSLSKLEKWRARADAGKVKSLKLLDSLAHHRRVLVRDESRATFLAYAFLRGKLFSSTESTSTVGNELVIPPKSIVKRASEIAYQNHLKTKFECGEGSSSENKPSFTMRFENWLTV
jgi:hypothetical protein